MSVKVLGQVWDYELDARDRLVLMALADRCEHDGTAARPSIARICWMTGIPKRTVFKIMKSLRSRCVLVVTRRPGYHRPTEYRIVLNSLPRKLPFQPKGDTGAQAAPMTPQEKSAARTEKGAAASQKGVAMAAPDSSYDSSSDSLGTQIYDPNDPQQIRRVTRALEDGRRRGRSAGRATGADGATLMSSSASAS